MIQPEPEDLPKDNPKLEIAVLREVNDREIKDAMFTIGDNKAPGPDGFSAKFFKNAWHIVCKDVCRAVKEFFSNGQRLGELNATIISLVPKIESPFKVSGFRPIACCNVVYKCISKILTRRIKGCLDKLINLNQSAFIPSRQIQDNILLAQELVKGYGRSGGPKRITYKIDIQKAYDSVKWYFKGGRGLRQGDPMPPYLFTLLMEVIKKSLEEFGNCSGLLPNFSKLLLIASVLEAIQMYWCNVFLLPKTMVKEINKILKNFLWNNEEVSRGSAKVAWKKIYIVVQHFKYEIGDGKKIYMWFDNWSGSGPLINYISNRSLYDERIKRTCHVADLVGSNSWNWPDEWYATYPFIQNLTVPLINTNKEDKVSWISKNGEKQKFSKSIVYHELKNDNGKWYRVDIMYCWPIYHVINWPWEELINYDEPLRVYEERNSECVKDEPTWSSIYTVRRLGWVYWKSPSYSMIGCYIQLDDAYSVTCLSIVDVG
ncbi:RNA-directed DNA polymerase, eukaryota, reverse transcriptase zinc-binding domain protein [Tanacetum coccineum]